MFVGKFLWGNSHSNNSYGSGANFLGCGYPDIEESICKVLSSVHALTLTFIRKTFILQTHNLRV